MSSFVAVGAPRRFVSILISSALAYTDSEMELTRTCCFEFDRMLRADSKRVLLSTFCFYSIVACFTHRSPHPEVDNIPDVPTEAAILPHVHPLDPTIREAVDKQYISPL